MFFPTFVKNIIILQDNLCKYIMKKVLFAGENISTPNLKGIFKLQRKQI